ncbi:MAG: hypothetical protein ACEPOV_01170 [Hyphomicrobiales bacterium]
MKKVFIIGFLFLSCCFNLYSQSQEDVSKSIHNYYKNTVYKDILSQRKGFDKNISEEDKDLLRGLRDTVAFYEGKMNVYKLKAREEKRTLSAEERDFIQDLRLKKNRRIKPLKGLVTKYQKEFAESKEEFKSFRDKWKADIKGLYGKHLPEYYDYYPFKDINPAAFILLDYKVENDFVFWKRIFVSLDNEKILVPVDHKKSRN